MIIYGDSFSSNDNGVSWVDEFSKLSQGTPCVNKAVSGSCFGNYSLYPVISNGVDEVINTYNKGENEIILSYGINDVSSIIMNYTTLDRVLIDINKCVDHILQNNPDCHISFLFLSENDKVIQEMANKQYEYLSTYFPKGFMDFNVTTWEEYYNYFYKEIINYFKQYIYINLIPMYNDCKEYVDNLLPDNMHPNINGAHIIANRVIEEGNFGTDLG